MRYRSIWLAAMCLALAIYGCHLKREWIITGKTMGTTYRIKVVAGFFRSVSHLEAAVEKRLLEINRSMSIYIPASEISRFNSLRDTAGDIAVSDDFWSVLKSAESLHGITGGAWDGTVKPLVDLWGFGSADKGRRLPQAGEVAALMSRIGFAQIHIAENRTIRKKNPAVSLDFGSIAKGYGVDQVSALLRSEGIDHFIVEIGGEVYASGHRKDGGPWRVGIDRPIPELPPDRVYRIVELENKALATSGDYRNFFEKDGVRYSHIIDPRTGHPVVNRVVSASVVADSCTFADGLATALMVIGPEKGIPLVNGLAGVECLIVVQSPDGTLIEHASDGFRAIQ